MPEADRAKGRCDFVACDSVASPNLFSVLGRDSQNDHVVLSQCALCLNALT